MLRADVTRSTISLLSQSMISLTILALSILCCQGSLSLTFQLFLHAGRVKLDIGTGGEIQEFARFGYRPCCKFDACSTVVLIFQSNKIYFCSCIFCTAKPLVASVTNLAQDCNSLPRLDQSHRD